MPDNVRDATQAGAPSQAQTTSNEPDQVAAADPQAIVDEHSEADLAEETGAAGTDAPIQHFEGTVAKRDRDGNLVLSDHLMPGEQLARDTELPEDLSEERNPAALAETRQREAAQERRDATREEALTDDTDGEDSSTQSE